MDSLQSLRDKARQFIKRLPLVENWRRKRQLEYFLSDKGYASHFGVFTNFEEARLWLPKSQEFDQEKLATEYVAVRMRRVFSYDYPVMFWLNQALNQGAVSVLDIGGSVGVHFYAYQKMMTYPPSLTWLVYEVPAIAEFGKEIAERKAIPNLFFTESLEPQGIEADIWMAAGAIHYINNARPGALLAKSKSRPRHVILNKLPLYDGEDFVSTQNIGEHSFAPHYVYNRQRFIDEIVATGYNLVDSWQTPEREFHLFGYPDKSFGVYSGLYFRISSVS